jgi:hypothetical protein
MVFGREGEGSTVRLAQVNTAATCEKESKETKRER